MVETVVPAYHNVNAKPKIVPVVLPASRDKSLSGRIRNLIVRTIPHTDWLEPDGEGGWTLTKAYERKGYAMLEDLYRFEDNEAGWKQYVEYLGDWNDGRTGSPFPFALLPKEVQDRQRGVVPADKLDKWATPKVAPNTGKLSEDKPDAEKPSKGK